MIHALILFTQGGYYPQRAETDIELSLKLKLPSCDIVL
jgi:hypothetical protein